MSDEILGTAHGEIYTKAEVRRVAGWLSSQSSVVGSLEQIGDHAASALIMRRALVGAVLHHLLVQGLLTPQAVDDADLRSVMSWFVREGVVSGTAAEVAVQCAEATGLAVDTVRSSLQVAQSLGFIDFEPSAEGGAT